MMDARARDRLGHWRREWGVLALAALAALPLFTPRLYGSDEIKYFSILRSAYFDRDLHYANEYQYFIDADPVAHAEFRALAEEPTATGYRLNSAPIGSALLWAPFYAGADVVVLVARALGSTVVRDGFAYPYVFAVCLGSLIWGLAGLALVYRLCRAYTSRFAAGTAVIGLWFASPLVFYVYVTPPMAHANSLFAVALFLFLWHRIRRADVRVGPWAVLGASAGLMVLVRELNWLFVSIVAVEELLALWRQASVAPSLRAALATRLVPRLPGYLAFAGTLALMALPQFAVYSILNGTLGPTPFVVEKFSWWPWHAGEVLFSGFHGLFSWTPITLVGALGLWAVRRDDRPLAISLATIFVVQVLVIGSYDTWWGGASFGARRFINCTPIFALGLAALVERVQLRMPRVIVPALLALIGWNLALVIQYSTGIIPRDRPVSMTTIIYNQFVEVPPRLTTIAWRFLTDRSSFYRTRS